ncbi:gasdermin-D [Cricetulus griseus]|nr:gasdermin-D [Cricetulus griseus]
MTMFENVTRALARQLNPRGDLTPLDSLIDFKRFHPFCLVLRKRKSTLFWGARYVRTDYTLLDVLEPGSSPSDPTDCGNFSFKNMLDARVEGDVDVPKTVKGSVNHKEAVTIPKGCVLAFRVRQLMVNGKDEWDIPHICNDSMQTFPPGEKPGEEKFILIQASDVGKEFGECFQGFTTQLEGALDKGHEVTLEALPKDVLLSKDAMGAVLYFLGALTGRIKAIQLEYSEARRTMTNALRKAPQHTAVGFKQTSLQTQKVSGSTLVFGTMSDKKQ